MRFRTEDGCDCTFKFVCFEKGERVHDSQAEKDFEDMMNDAVENNVEVEHVIRRALETDTFRIKLTKQRKSAIIQFSRCCSDNKLQLDTHIHQPAFIGAVGMNIPVECQRNAAVTEDGREDFHVEAIFGGISRKCVAELVIIVVFYLRRLQYLLVAVLHRARLNRLVRTR